MHRTLLALLVVLAGCSGPASDPAGPAPAGSVDASAATGAGAPAGNGTLAVTPRPPTVTLEAEGCRQLHAFFPFPIAALEELGFTLPEGFTYASEDGATVNVFFAWWFCQASRLNGTVPPAPAATQADAMLAAIPVVPPSGLPPAPGPLDLEIVPISWTLDDQATADQLAAWGLSGIAEKGSVVHESTTSVAGATADTASSTASFGAFSIATVVQGAMPNPESDYRLWTSSGGKADGYLFIENRPGDGFGEGAANLRFTGEPLAGPPIAPGLAHVVGGIDVVVSRHVLAPPA